MFLVLLFSLLLSCSASLPSFYHSSEEILSKATELCHHSSYFRCPEKNLIVISGTHPNHDSRFYTFGEHARELITSELALHLLHHFAQHQPTQTTLIVPIVNLWGRKQVERGQSCLRKNEHQVDLNRNYPQKIPHFYSKSSEEYQGPHPLSEPESTLNIKHIRQYHPKTYINVHSGEFALYTGFDSSNEYPPNYHLMYQQLLKWKHFCPKCRLGRAAIASSYRAFGTSVDYVLSNRLVDFAFTFEIYGSNSNHCFNMFNPNDFKTYQHILHLWTQILK